MTDVNKKKTILDFKNIQIRNARIPTHVMPLYKLWETKTVILVFLRRLGCKLSRAYMSEMQDRLGTIRRKGVSVIALTHETPGKGSDFDLSFTKSRYWLGPLFLVPKQMFEELFGRKIPKPGLSIVSVDGIALELVEKHSVQGNRIGDFNLLGGEFIVSKEDQILLDHRQSYYGDDASFDDIFYCIDNYNKQKNTICPCLIF